MANTPLRRGVFVLLPAVWLLAGCQRDVYRHDTVLHSDGSVTRTVFQSSESIREPEAWASISRAPRDYDGDLDAPFGPEELRPQVAEKDPAPDGNAARGTFSSPMELPAHFLRESSTGTGESRLERLYDRKDWGLFIEHRWSEMVTDSVTISESQQATRELAELTVELITEALNRAYGEDYDFTRLEAWMRTEGVAWFGEVVGAYLQVSTLKLQEGPFVVRLYGDMARISRRYGLVLPEPDGQSHDYNRRIEEFLADKLKELIERRDGQDVEDEVVEAILRSKDQSSLPAAVAWEQVIAERYGDSKGLEQETRTLLDQIVGVYGGHLTGLLGKPVGFEFGMEVPGTVVETNGTLLSDQRVLWKFDGEQVFPFGYPMTCRAIEPRVELQKLIWDGKTITGREAMLEALRLLENATLRAVLVECARDSNTDALERLRAEADVEENADALETLRRLEELAR